SSRRRHTRCLSDWSSDVCSSDLFQADLVGVACAGVDHDLPLPSEHPGHAAGGAQVAAGAAEEVADITAGAVAVVGQGVDDDGHAMRSVALEAKLLERGATQLTGAALDS